MDIKLILTDCEITIYKEAERGWLLFFDNSKAGGDGGTCSLSWLFRNFWRYIKKLRGI